MTVARRARSRAACAGLALAWVCAGETPARAATLRRAEIAQSPSDRALFQDAQKSLAALQGSRRLQAQRAEWDSVVSKFRRVAAKYPQSSLADDALFTVGGLLRQIAVRFKSPRAREDALSAYRTIVQDYPRSKEGEPALFAVYEIQSESGDRRLAVAAGRGYLESFPDGAHAPLVRAVVRKLAPAPEPPLPTPPPPGLAQVLNLRLWNGESSTRVVLDVEKELPFKYDHLQNPDRLFVDIQGARLRSGIADKSFPGVGEGALQQVRVAQNKDNVVRVVLDFKNASEQQIFYLRDPVRLVIDVRDKSPTAPPFRVADSKPVAEAPDVPEIPVARKITGVLAADPAGSSASARRAPRLVLEGNAPTDSKPASAAAARAPLPGPAQTNRSGQYSLARQLGLSARRIVIDAGHGGHDPGTIGAAGLQEKDLVLDVALRVEKMVRSQLHAEVIMTRSNDTFVPLEERTAIANAKGADLFLSIHANSSRNPTARGIETYYLNFAKNPDAESVAARENAISAATLKDLQNLVKAIALNSKIDESREFATLVQEALVQNVKARDPNIPDRGVHTAPFYVLIGANMPSILAEIAFVSHPGEERLLRSDDHRDLIARSLFQGVKEYLDGLSRTPAPVLTALPQRTRVAERASPR